MGEIQSIEKLEAVVGKKPPALDLKIVDHIDPCAQAWLSHSSLMVACLGAADGVAVTLAGGPSGFASGSNRHLSIPLDRFDGHYQLHEGLAFGSLWMVSGMGETLRLNGRVQHVEPSFVTVLIDECFLHCAKAFIRSDFWNAAPLKRAFGSVDDFISQARFIALGTVGRTYSADLSPKGDPAGLLAKLHGDCLLFADRPGNKRTDSFRNLLTQPKIAGASLVPGSAQIVDFAGKAELSSDPDLCSQFAVDGKTPKLVTKVTDAKLKMRTSSALEAAKLWPSAPAPRDLDPAKIFAAHMRLSKDRSLSAQLSKTIVSVPGLMNSALKSDYKRNLY